MARIGRKAEGCSTKRGGVFHRPWVPNSLVTVEGAMTIKTDDVWSVHELDMREKGRGGINDTPGASQGQAWVGLRDRCDKYR